MSSEEKLANVITKLCVNDKFSAKSTNNEAIFLLSIFITLTEKKTEMTAWRSSYLDITACCIVAFHALNPDSISRRYSELVSNSF